MAKNLHNKLQSTVVAKPSLSKLLQQPVYKLISLIGASKTN